MRRTKAEAEVTRKDLLAAALTVFSRDGYAGARLDDIAEIAGVSKGAIFHHFGSKAGLYFELMSGITQRYAEHFAQLDFKAMSACDVLRHLLITPLVLSHKDPVFRAINELMYIRTGIPPELEANIAVKLTEMRSFVDRIVTVLQAGIEAGEFRPDINPYDVAVSALAQQSGLMAVSFLDPELIDLDDQINRIADLFIQSIAVTT